MARILFSFSIMIALTVGQLQAQRFISVRGESEINIVPDRIELTIVFTETENLKRENELQQKEAELIKLLKSYSIDLKNLSIDNYSANRYGYYKSNSNKVRMSKVFKLQYDQLEIFDVFMVKLFEIGANQVAVTNLHSERLEELKLESTIIALDKAKRKAQTMAEYSGNSIGEILEITEYNPEILSSGKGEFLLQSKSSVAYGVNASYNSEGEDIGIRKIRIRYAVDVKYELK